VPNHPAKERAYARARKYLGEATASDDPPLRRVAVPFAGRAGEGAEVAFYVLRPPAVERPPVVLVWGGIDTWKEEMYERLGLLFRERGCAALLLDMPGVGESPVLAGRDAERQWTPIFDWIATQDDLDASRCAAVGASFGGYWAMKLAYTHRERLTCCVNWGGGVHVTFTPEWQERSRNASSYLIDLMAARARIFGGTTFEDYVARCPELSLLDQGLLDRPSAPILLVNGRNDVQNSIDDIYLSLDHGDPKAARIFDGGHMGEGPVVPTIVEWVLRGLRQAPST
jgi:pimeloyl-ACP methyl ester carboxylesterase